MADELIIQGLRIPSERGGGSMVVDAIIEFNFSQSDKAPSHEEICREIEGLCRITPSGALESTVTSVVEGLLERFPSVLGVELTMRILQPELPGFELDAIGVRKRQRRPKPPHRLPRRETKPLPRP